MSQDRQFEILWGPSLENEISFSYPVVGESVRAWRAVRDGSEQMAVGNETDVSVTGQDYWLAVTAKWFDLEHATDPTGLQAFIQWANDGNVFTLRPDDRLPTLTVPGCMLIQPFADPDWSVESGGEMTVSLLFRHPTIDLGLAWRGLFAEYVANGRLMEPTTSLRNSISMEIGPLGILNSNAVNAAADGHYPGGLIATGAATGLQTALVQDDVTNEAASPEDLTTGSWTKNECTISANHGVAPDGALTADLIVESVTASAIHTVTTSPAETLVSGDKFVALCYVKDGGRHRGIFWLNDAATGAGGNRAGVLFDLSNGTITGNQILGTGSMDASKITPLAGGWFQIWIRGSLGTTTTGYLTLRLCDSAGTGTYTGDGASGMYFWGATWVHGAGTAPCVANYVPTTSVFSNVSWEGPIVPNPQELWVYTKWFESGGAFHTDTRLWTFGADGFTAPYLAVQLSTTFGMRAIVDLGSGLFTSTFTGSMGTYGDVIELLVLLNTTGIQAVISVNGGAEVILSSSSGPGAFPRDWSAHRFRLGGGNGTGAKTTAMEAYNSIKVGPLVQGDARINSIAKARAV